MFYPNKFKTLHVVMYSSFIRDLPNLGATRMLAGEWIHRLLDPELYEQSRKAQDKRPGAMESKCVLLMDKAVWKRLHPAGV